MHIKAVSIPINAINHREVCDSHVSYSLAQGERTARRVKAISPILSPPLLWRGGQGVRPRKALFFHAKNDARLLTIILKSLNLSQAILPENVFDSGGLSIADLDDESAAHRKF